MEDDIRRHLEARQDRAAFDLLVERFKDKVFRLAFSILRNQTQAEDLTQDVFVKIWKNLGSYNGGASLSTWIYTITRNTCLTELKRRTAHPTISLDEPGFEATRDALPALQSAEREAGVEMDVNQMLGQLPGQYRQVITLFYLEAKSYEEVSALLGLPMGTVKTFLFRARKALLKLSQRRAPLPVLRPNPISA